MDHYSTTIELVRQRAAAMPNQLAYTFLAEGEQEERSITYLELEERARAIGGWLQSCTRVNDRILLLLPPGLEYVEAFFGCAFGGVIAVPAYPPRRRVNRGEGRISAIMQDAAPSVVLTNQAIAPKLLHGADDGKSEIGHVQEVERISQDWAQAWKDPAIREETIAFIQYTSGSTALPKGVMVSHGNLLHNQQMIRDACHHNASSTFVGWLPLYHDMGLVGNIMQPLYIGSSCILMSPVAFVQKPVRWLRAISRYRAHTSGGPNFAYDLCVRKITDQECEGLDLSSWSVAFNGAEPVRQETLDRFAEKFRPYGFDRHALTPCYGLAEASLIVSCKERFTLPKVKYIDAQAADRHQVREVMHGPGASRVHVGCGPAVRDTNIMIVNPVTRSLCTEADIGEVWVSGSGVAQGYWNKPEETENLLRARLGNGDASRFLRTGDLGFIRDGELFITGRLKDLIIIRGRKYCAEDIEWTIQSRAEAVHAVGAFSIQDQGEEKLVIAVEAEQLRSINTVELARLIRRVTSEQFEIEAHLIVMLERGQIPRTSSGKIQRKMCHEKFLNGELTLARHAGSQRAPAIHANAVGEQP